MAIDGIKPIKDRSDELVLPNGSRFISLPCTSSTIRGYPADDVYLDELAHYKRDTDVMQAIMPSLSRTDKFRRLTIGSTPLGKRGEFYRIWKEDANYTKFKVDIYDAIQGGCPVDVSLCRRLSPSEIAFRQEFLCDFLDEVFSFFPFDLINECWDDTLDYGDCSKLTRLYAGYDPGKIVDSGVFTVVESTPLGVVSKFVKKWHGVDYTEQLKFIETFCKSNAVVKLNVDATGVGVKIVEDLILSLGNMVEGITFTIKTKELLLSNLRILMQDKRIKFPYDKDLLNQLHGTERIISEAGNVKYEFERRDGNHGDKVCSLALACFGATQVSNVGHFDDDYDKIMLDRENRPELHEMGVMTF